MNLSFLISLLTGEAAAAAQRAGRSVVEYLLVAIAALVGIVFLLVAAFVFVADNLRYGALYTALMFGGFFLLLALAIFIYHRVGAAARERRAREKRQNDMKAAMSGAFIAALPTLLSRRGGIAGLAAAAIGAVGLAIYHENTRPKDKDGG